MDPDEICRARFGLDKAALLAKLHGERRRELPQQSAVDRAKGVPGVTRTWMKKLEREKIWREHS